MMGSGWEIDLSNTNNKTINQYRDKLGCFEKGKYTRTQLVALGCLIGLPLGIIADREVEARTVHTFIDRARAKAAPKEGQIGRAPLKTREEIEWKIRATFPEAPELFVKIASCESDFIVNAHNTKTDDSGVFQINYAAHGAKLEKLGLNPWDARDNIEYARMLYEKNGTRDWNSSKHCWSK